MSWSDIFDAVDRYQEGVKKLEKKVVLKALEPNSLNMRELLVGDISRMRYVRRYGTSLVLHQENVAEHSYYVVLYSYFVALWCADHHGKDISIERLMARAIVHDIDEARTGDFQRPFKHSSEQMKVLLDGAAQKEVASMVEAIFPGNPYNNALVSHWSFAKDGTLEGHIVEFADFLSVVSYLWQESRYASQTMATHYETMKKHVANFRHERFDFIRPLVQSVEEIVAEIVKEAL